MTEVPRRGRTGSVLEGGDLSGALCANDDAEDDAQDDKSNGVYWSLSSHISEFCLVRAGGFIDNDFLKHSIAFSFSPIEA